MNTKTVIILIAIMANIGITVGTAQTRNREKAQQSYDRHDERPSRGKQAKFKKSKAKQWHKKRMFQMAKADGRISPSERRILRQEGRRSQRTHRCRR
jgi:uncharacterized membrane protein YebE (DUF533 family)